MFKKIKKFYESKSAREKILLFALLWAALIIWMSSVISYQREISMHKEGILLKIETAELLIAQSDVVEKRMNAAKDKFDNSKFIEDLRVEIEGIMKSRGITKFGMTFAPDVKSDKMTIRNVNLSLQGESMERLISLENEFALRTPYLSIKCADFSSDGKGVMSARYEIVSFEFNKQ